MVKGFKDKDGKFRPTDNNGSKRDLSGTPVEVNVEIDNNSEEFSEGVKNDFNEDNTDVIQINGFEIPILNQKIFYHATKHKNVKSIIDNKFDSEKIGEATGKRHSGNLLWFDGKPNSGDGFYVAKDKETAMIYGGGMIEIILKPDTLIMNVEPYWLKGDNPKPKLPFIDDFPLWYKNYILNYLEESGKKNEDPDHYNKVKEYYSKQENLDNLLKDIDPSGRPSALGGNFDSREFVEKMALFARANGFDGINVDSTDTVLFNNECIENIRKIK